MLTDLKDPTECRCFIDSRDVIAAIRRKETSAILVEDIPRGIEFEKISMAADYVKDVK